MTKKQLKEYCDAEFENIEAVLSDLVSLLGTNKSNFTTVELAAIATFIHNIYNGMENVLKRNLIYRKIEQKDSPTWHKDLLKSASDTKIIPDEMFDILSTYLSFRHFFVHSYSFYLKWDELKPLVTDIEDTIKKFKASISKCIETLE